MFQIVSTKSYADFTLDPIFRSFDDFIKAKRRLKRTMFTPETVVEVHDLSTEWRFTNDEPHPKCALKGRTWIREQSNKRFIVFFEFNEDTIMYSLTLKD